MCVCTRVCLCVCARPQASGMLGQLSRLYLKDAIQGAVLRREDPAVSMKPGGPVERWDLADGQQGYPHAVPVWQLPTADLGPPPLTSRPPSSCSRAPNALQMEPESNILKRQVSIQVWYRKEREWGGGRGALGQTVRTHTFTASTQTHTARIRSPHVSLP